jgi:hypothetical protein
MLSNLRFWLLCFGRATMAACCIIRPPRPWSSTSTVYMQVSDLLLLLLLWSCALPTLGRSAGAVVHEGPA